MLKRILIIVGIIVLFIIVAFSIFLIYLGMNFGKTQQIEKTTITTEYGDRFIYKLERATFPDPDYRETLMHQKFRQVVYGGGGEYPDTSLLYGKNIEPLLSLNNKNYYLWGKRLLITNHSLGELQTFSVEGIVNREIDVPLQILNRCEEVLDERLNQ